MARGKTQRRRIVKRRKTRVYRGGRPVENVLNEIQRILNAQNAQNAQNKKNVVHSLLKLQYGPYLNATLTLNKASNESKIIAQLQYINNYLKTHNDLINTFVHRKAAEITAVPKESQGPLYEAFRVNIARIKDEFRQKIASSKNYIEYVDKMQRVVQALDNIKKHPSLLETLPVNALIKIHIEAIEAIKMIDALLS
jgi:hypothetical protein